MTLRASRTKGSRSPRSAASKAYLDDDSNFTNDSEIGLQRAAKQRLERLWSTGDPDKAHRRQRQCGERFVNS